MGKNVNPLKHLRHVSQSFEECCWHPSRPTPTPDLEADAPRLIEKPIIHYSMQLLSRKYEQIPQHTAMLDFKQARFTLNNQPS